ncbi:flavin-containing monooxygenase [Aspergillus homomorphus CBS 101889]|uniref:Putative flavin-binding monooxygenase n=1 Tax=Aspergillus homomorphus (strain CBS 101889) TaxID=1450537 RepID=A0A395HJP9_ASPHC|nr:putative flavin-binding monooxygenase [Aspergillus homomorphus CBS 101889]RAL07846.1 putative flavin-binding monooxygenase [Aspergillus homomorphus CBS 101889]
MPSRESPFPEPTEYTIDPQRFAFTPRKVRVVCIGAGYAGLNLAYKLQHESPLDFVDFTIYEKNAEVGGTWFENTYPGVGCDVPAHSYVFPFKANPDWSQCYAKGPEIEKYIVDTAEEFGLKKHIVFNTRLTKAIWNEAKGKWVLELTQSNPEDSSSLQLHDEADVLLNAGGVLNRWKWPEIEGLRDKFQGKVVHTAAWDASYDWAGKRIAVIGNGSSGLQVVPALQPKAARIVNYIRQPTWVSMNLCPDITPDGLGTNFKYTEEEKNRFRNNPEEFLAYRKRVDNSVNTVYRLMLSSPMNDQFKSIVEKMMRQQLGENPDLIDKLIPNTSIGCRRLSPGDGYLEAMQQPNAAWNFDAIQHVTETGIQTTEGEEKFDLIVCATGFDTSFIPAWELVGRDGRQLQKEWKHTPKAYFSVCAAGMPNYFVFGGPNCAFSHGNLPQMLAWSADYMLQWIRKIAREDIHSIVVKDDVVRQYNRHAQAGLKRTVWTTGCQAWYNNGTTVTAMYPGSVLQYKGKFDPRFAEAISYIRGEDFDIKYRASNPFAYLGNGELEWERAEDADLSFYLK